MAVGLPLRDLLKRDIAAGAGAVLDYDGEAGPFTKPVASNARQGIVGSARSDRHHDPDRLRRQRLGRRRRA